MDVPYEKSSIKSGVCHYPEKKWICLFNIKNHYIPVTLIYSLVLVSCIKEFSRSLVFAYSYVCAYTSVSQKRNMKDLISFFQDNINC